MRLTSANIGVEQFDFAPIGITFPNSTSGPQRHIIVKRMILTADAPRKVTAPKKGRRMLNVTVLLGDPRLPDPVKRGGRFNDRGVDSMTMR